MVSNWCFWKFYWQKNTLLITVIEIETETNLGYIRRLSLPKHPPPYYVIGSVNVKIDNKLISSISDFNQPNYDAGQVAKMSCASYFMCWLETPFGYILCYTILGKSYKLLNNLEEVKLIIK